MLSPSFAADTQGGMMPLRVARKTLIAGDIHLFELVQPDGAPLPAFTAGAHVTVLTPNGLTRRYSLCNAPGETHRYQFAVQRDAAGQGGSMEMTDRVQEGDLMPTTAPINHFALDPGAASYLLIGGGIGITPLLAMVRELDARAARFQLLYLTRTLGSTAFLDVLQQPGLAASLVLHHDQGDLEQALDLGPWLSQPAAGTHVYCCGPRGLMQAVREQTRHWPSGSVTFEDFGSAAEIATSTADRAFAVRLVRSGRLVAVGSGVSILEALRREQIAVPSSCESGTCGSCRTGLVSGVADHRDYVLDEEQHGSEIMICVSRAVSPLLELDL